MRLGRQSWKFWEAQGGLKQRGPGLGSLPGFPWQSTDNFVHRVLARSITSPGPSLLLSRCWEMRHTHSPEKPATLWKASLHYLQPDNIVKEGPDLLTGTPMTLGQSLPLSWGLVSSFVK